MTIASISPAASATKAAAAMMQVHKAYAAQPTEAPASVAAKEQPAPIRAEITSRQTEVIVQANATGRALAAVYDNRITGATETVRSFDRISMIEKGFEHIRELFAMANPDGQGAEGGEIHAATDATAGGMDLRL